MQSSSYRLETLCSMTAGYCVTVTQFTKSCPDYRFRNGALGRSAPSQAYLIRHTAVFSSACCGITAVSVSDPWSGKGLPCVSDSGT